MNKKTLYPYRLYLRKFLNSFLPEILFKLSPKRGWAQNYWKTREKGDTHGFDNYCVPHPRLPIIISEIQSRAQPQDTILDLGCNCGYYLSVLKKEGYKKLSGIDISPIAIKYGKEQLGLSDVNLMVGSFEDVLPGITADGTQYDLVYTLGATIELVHPSFDIVGSICAVSRKYVILIINEWGHDYPRFWEYEFNNNGFLLVKCIRPYNGVLTNNAEYADSLMVFQRIS